MFDEDEVLRNDWEPPCHDVQIRMIKLLRTEKIDRKYVLKSSDKNWHKLVYGTSSYTSNLCIKNDLFMARYEKCW